MKIDLTGIETMKIVVPSVFLTSHVADPVLRATQKGLHDIELCAVTMINHELNDYAIRLEDVSDLFGGNTRTLRREVKEANKAAHDFFPGEYDPPEVMDPDKLIYGITAIIIAEASRLNHDIDQYIVRTNMDSLFDIGAIDNYHDFACYRTLIEYFEYCLSDDKLYSLNKFIKMRGGKNVSEARMMTFLKKNFWYTDADEFESRFRFGFTYDATLSKIAEAGFTRFQILKQDALKRKEAEDENN